MKKIGVITQYYDSKNYGGNLQAYALVGYLSDFNYDIEQICFVGVGSNLNLKYKSKLNYFKKRFARVLHVFSILNRKIQIKKLSQDILRRKHCFNYFNKTLIKHSDFVCNNDMTLQECEYDLYITGSDQVWNLNNYVPSYFLDFVPSGKKKIAYAASISMDNLTDEQKEIFRRSLKDFDAVSVREVSDVELIKDLSPVPVVNTLDPTLLLTREEWDEVCSDRAIDDKYLFCYFLGNNKKERKLAKEFAVRKGLKVVTLPHMNGYQSADKNFGDYQLWDIGPEKFLSLVKHADYVFTDSFHAIVFSNIYHKQYFVFNRSSRGEMSSRIYNITDLFDEQDRYCDTKDKESIDHIENLAPINYDREFNKFEEMKKISIEFLKNSLGEPDKKANED